MKELLTRIAGVPGFKVAGVHAGLKADGKPDVALIVSDTPCTAAGVFTVNHIKAAPVAVDMERLHGKQTGYRAVLINTKCANACTGNKGIENALETARWVAEGVGCREEEVLVMSTGVIGTHLPMDKIRHGVSQAVDALSDSPDAWQQAAEAILTTDTRPKLGAVKTASGYAVAGIAKGSGMIAPHMATMLGIIVTDAPLSAAQARESLQAANHESFNRIVVDGDMSTNDTVLLLSSAIHTADQPDLRDFNPALAAVCTHLAKAIVRDGEGATKFITIQVVAAASDDAAKTIANAIATSPLVKTAFYGGDANWGRIVAAAGRAGVPVDPTKLQLWFAGGEEAQPDLLLFQNGMPTDYSEAAASEIMSRPSITVMLDCGQGDGQAVIWTCDLSHDYVSINGHYRS